MKKYIFYIILSFLITTQFQPEKRVVKETVKMALVSGLIPTRPPMKGIGQAHKNMDKELKLGQMDTFTKVNLTKVTGVDKEF